METDHHTSVHQLSLKDLLPFLPCKGQRASAARIARYLRQLARRYGATAWRCLQLPSPAKLAEYFDAPYSDVIKALHIMQKQGYDYISPGLYRPVGLWCFRSQTPGTNAEEREPWQWVSVGNPHSVVSTERI